MEVPYLTQAYGTLLWVVSIRGTPRCLLRSRLTGLVLAWRTSSTIAPGSSDRLSGLFLALMKTSTLGISCTEVVGGLESVTAKGGRCNERNSGETLTNGSTLTRWG